MLLPWLLWRRCQVGAALTLNTKMALRAQRKRGKILSSAEVLDGGLVCEERAKKLLQELQLMQGDRGKAEPLLTVQVQLCGCCVMVFQTRLLLGMVAESCSLQAAGPCSGPRYPTEGMWTLQSPSGHMEWLQGVCWSQKHPGHHLYS